MKQGWKVAAVSTAHFNKYQDKEVPTVAVLTDLEGRLIIASKFLSKIDDTKLTEHLVRTLQRYSWFEAANLVVFSALSFAGLGIIDLEQFYKLSKKPVILISRKQETRELENALTTAKLTENLPILERLPPAYSLVHSIPRGKIRVYLRWKGLNQNIAIGVAKKMLTTSHVPQPIIVAHRIAILFNT